MSGATNLYLTVATPANQRPTFDGPGLPWFNGSEMYEIGAKIVWGSEDPNVYRYAGDIGWVRVNSLGLYFDELVADGSGDLYARADGTVMRYDGGISWTAVSNSNIAHIVVDGFGQLHALQKHDGTRCYRAAARTGPKKPTMRPGLPGIQRPASCR